MRFTRGDVGDHIVSSKNDMDLRSGVESDAAEKSKDHLSRDFSDRSIFDFCNNSGT
jgi:hypothetical protein